MTEGCGCVKRRCWSFVGRRRWPATRRQYRSTRTRIGRTKAWPTCPAISSAFRWWHPSSGASYACISAGMGNRSISRRVPTLVDFKKGWWHPPVDPQTVLASETSQIRQVLGLRPVVSITDHDSIEAGLELQRQHSHALVPLSFEWTVPFHQGFFHLGVHNLRSESATRLFQALSAYTPP